MSIKFLCVSADGQGTKCRRKIAENFNRLSRVHERYRQTDRRQTDGRATANSERERELSSLKSSHALNAPFMLVNFQQPMSECPWRIQDFERGWIRGTRAMPKRVPFWSPCWG